MEIIKDKINWTNTIRTHFQSLRDVYFEYDYFELFAKSFNVVPEAIFWENESIKIFWTHFIRKIRNLDLYKNHDLKENYDLITPYGYGGPLIIKKTGDLEKLNSSFRVFLDKYRKYALKEKYVCEFIRFHPILKNWELLEGLINVKYVHDTVALDLTQSYEDIWSNMSKKTRYYTKKALKEFEDYQIIEDPSGIEIEDFTRLYNKTMEKNNAAKKYFFSKDFIADHYLFDNLLIYCRNQDKIIGSSAIFLKGNFILHYHLSATNYLFQNPSSRAVLWRAIEWAKENGCKWLHFGGGVSKNDSLFQFKKGFSNTYLPFYIGFITFNQKTYDELTSLNRNVHKDPGFFPAYRVGYDDKII